MRRDDGEEIASRALAAIRRQRIEPAPIRRARPLFSAYRVDKSGAIQPAARASTAASSVQSATASAALRTASSFGNVGAMRSVRSCGSFP